MVPGLGGTLKNIVKGGAAVISGSLEQHEYQSFRESLSKGCMYLFSFIYVLFTLIRITLPIHHLPIKYTWAELLINYQAGFVRRGLLGEILFRLQPVIPSVVTASVLIFACYCMFTYLVLKLLRDAPLVVFAFFVFSPAGFLFPVYDPAIFGRKEIFFFLAFALTIFTCRRFSDHRIKVCSFVLLYTIATLVHEAAMFFAPLAACTLVFSMDERNERRVTVLCSLLFYIFAIGVFLLLSIDPNYDPTGIIRSWNPYFPFIGTGSALTYLDKSWLEILVMVKNRVADFNRFTLPYMADFCLAFLPVIVLLIHTTLLEFFSTLRKKEPFLFMLSTAALLAQFVLLCSMLDWGRTIYFISMHTFIFLISLVNFGLAEYKATPPISRYQWKMYTVFFLYYTLLWRMPHLRQ